MLKRGIPTVAVRQLGVYPRSRSDLYGFAAHGIVFPAVDSIRDLRADAVAAFFDADWAVRFARYDASYLRPVDLIGSEVRSAVRGLYEHTKSETASSGTAPSGAMV